MSQAPLEVRTLAVEDEATAVGLIVDAFASDPVARWVFPHDQQYRSLFPGLVRVFAAGAFQGGSVFGTIGHEGAALWLPPGVHPDDGPADESMQEWTGDHLDDLAGFLQRQASVHPHADHWYLRMLGVHPSKQGLGVGSALLAHTLRMSDEQGMPAYLESTSPGSRRLYERHGFEVIGEIQFGSSPTMWPMWREAR